MRRDLSGMLLVACLVGSTAAAPTSVVHEAEWARVDLGQDLPVDLISPEGKNRWELSALRLDERSVRTIETSEIQPDRSDSVSSLRSLTRSGVGTVYERFTRLTADSGALRSETFVDPTGRQGAARWLFRRGSQRGRGFVA